MKLRCHLCQKEIDVDSMGKLKGTVVREIGKRKFYYICAPCQVILHKLGKKKFLELLRDKEKARKALEEYSIDEREGKRYWKIKI
ncbi:hypothetical protein DRN46_02195 [Thermococci archaeon]|nr:MAG: hypothetical protein DRN46_02195 [Thermococci archaeon]RLF93265.1 MAG: hypothetical protein DRN52_06720 [Thermococci archaeon]